VTHPLIKNLKVGEQAGKATQKAEYSMQKATLENCRAGFLRMTVG